MLVNCFLLWLVHCKGVQLSQLHQQNCWLLLGWCTPGGAAVSAAPTELWGYCLVGALQGVQLSQLHQQSCWAAAWLVHCKGVQLSQLHQQNCWATAWLVHLRQVHPLKAPPESTLGYFTSTFFTLPLAVRTMLMPRCRRCMRTPPRV